MTRSEILDNAKEIITKSREAEYGAPEDNFSLIARFWNAYLGDNLIDAHDVANMMVLFKIARAKTGRGGADSYIDACGYAAIAGEIRSRGGSV